MAKNAVAKFWTLPVIGGFRDSRTLNNPPQWDTIPSVDFILGVPSTVDLKKVNGGWGYDIENDPIFFGEARDNSLPSFFSVSNDGVVTYTPKDADDLGEYDTYFQISDALVDPVVEPPPIPEPPPPTPVAGYTDIPELVFIEGIPETEQLGIYILDPQNRWPAGDFKRVQQWQSGSPISLRLNGTTTTVADSFLTVNPVNGELRYSGAAISTGKVRDYSVQMFVNGKTSEKFRIRILRPTKVYCAGPIAQAEDKAALHGWTGATVLSQETTPWFAPGGDVMRSGTSGKVDSDPHVVFMCSGEFPAQDWTCASKKKDTPSSTTYLYLLGDPDSRPILAQRNLAKASGKLNMTSLSAIWYMKNLELFRVTTSMTSLTSSYKAHMHMHSVKQQGCDKVEDAIAVSTSFDPYLYPAIDAVDAADGSLGTYFKVWLTHFEGIGNGNTGNTRHQMYIEGNGEVYLDINNNIVAGARACSTVKSICAYNRIRNSILSVAPDYDTFASALDTSIPWAQELLDIKGGGAIDTIVYNNDIRCGVSKVGANSKGTYQAFFWRGRRSAFGCSVPPYPDVQWSPPLGMDAYFGFGQRPIFGFPQGTETYVNDAYWAAVRAKPISDPTNPYTFKKFVAYNKFSVRSMDSDDQRPDGSIDGRVMFRDDGTSPVEMQSQFASATFALGAHPDWIDRSVTFAANNVYTEHRSTETLFKSYDGNIVRAENGAGNMSISYDCVFDNGSIQGTGKVRVNTATQDVRSWTESLDSIITSLPEGVGAGSKYSALNPPPLSEIGPFMTLTNPKYWPPAQYIPAIKNFTSEPLLVQVEDVNGNTGNKFHDSPPVVNPIALPEWFQL